MCGEAWIQKHGTSKGGVQDETKAKIGPADFRLLAVSVSTAQVFSAVEEASAPADPALSVAWTSRIE
jgi:hypothetical protein